MVDQICINQSDLQERLHQVSFLRQIYEHAISVAICLGDNVNGGRIRAVAERIYVWPSSHSSTDSQILDGDLVLADFEMFQ